jgi:hypothetical protein
MSGVSGSIEFVAGRWDGKSSATYFVLDFVAKQLPAGPEKLRIRELADDNVLLLNLSDPRDSVLADIIAADLPRHVAGIEDEDRRRNLHTMLANLYELAKRQQQYNSEQASKPRNR